jgi:hypothetical protein
MDTGASSSFFSVCFVYNPYLCAFETVIAYPLDPAFLDTEGGAPSSAQRTSQFASHVLGKMTQQASLLNPASACCTTWT